MNDTVNITIRGVPRQWRDSIAVEAQASGQSMQSYVMELLQRAAQAIDNRRLALELGAEQASLTGPALQIEDVLDAIRASRPDAGDLGTAHRDARS